MVKQWRFYHKHAITEMRPYIEGEDLTGISVSDGDEPKEGGMIARNPQDHNDQWYIAPEYFNDNYIKTTQAGVQEKRRSTELLAALGRVMFGYLQATSRQRLCLSCLWSRTKRKHPKCQWIGPIKALSAWNKVWTDQKT